VGRALIEVAREDNLVEALVGAQDLLAENDHLVRAASPHREGPRHRTAAM
jgi:hypothetical protein